MSFFFFSFLSSMSLKRLAFSDSFVSHRRKVFSGFSIGVGTLLIISLFFLSNSLRVPTVEVFVPGFEVVGGANSSFNSNNHSSSGSHHVKEGMSLENKTLLVNLTDENVKNASLHVGEEQGYAPKQDEKKNGGALVTDEKGLISRKSTGFENENSSMIAKDLDLHVEGQRVIAANNTSSVSCEGRKIKGEESMKNHSSFSANVGLEKNYNNVRNSSRNGKIEGVLHLIEKDMKNVTVIHEGDDSQQEKMQVGLIEKCDIFDGKWVRDDSKPYYPLGSCPLIDRDFDCHLNGRPDSEYVKWKWQPNGCNIPSLNATDFLERLRGQRLVFVGDSLNRNMWESLVCILRQSLRYKRRVFEISGRREFKKKGVYAFRFEDYNCSVDFVVSPFIVQESTFKGKNGSFETLRLDLIDSTTNRYKDADIIVFNTGHWWTHDKTSKGEDYYQEGNHVYKRLKVLDAYTRALTTWARWVDRNINPNQTQVFFRGFSITHFWGGQWNSGGQCHTETEPIFNETYLQKYPSKMWALEHVIRNMNTEVVYMNISRLTDYRKDGHPSVYRKDYKTSAVQNSTALFEDCSHWCLPGVPDTWNELLYVSLLKYGKGSWKL